MEGSGFLASNSINSSWVNPFSQSVNGGPPTELEDEEFVADGLSAFLNNEEKLHQSASSVKTDNGDRSCSVMLSGITMRSSMVESGDSDLIDKKMNISRYLAYRSEPLGQLGESISSRQRPRFSFSHEKSLLQSENSDPATSEYSPKDLSKNISEFKADFSQEPSWLSKKPSLSSLSSSENLDLSSRADSSGNWLIGTNNNKVTKPSEDHEAASSEIFELTEGMSNLNCKEKTEHVFKVPMSVQSSPDLVNESSAVPSVLVQEPAEMSELPSLYWKPTGSQSKMEKPPSEVNEEVENSQWEKRASQCQSYVTGHVEAVVSGNQLSDVGCSSQGSTSPASTVRENTDVAHCDSVIPEPQLSSTREFSQITDDCIELGLSTKRVTFHPDISQASLEAHRRHDTIPVPDMQSVPNMCSTARSQCSTYAREEAAGEDKEFKGWSVGDQKSVLEIMERSGIKPEDVLGLFSNTSSVATPVLMEKVKEFFQEKCNTAAASSGIGESGFDASENLSGDLPGDLPGDLSVNLPADFVAEERIEEAQFKMNRRSLKNRHTLATVEHSTPAAKSPKTDDFMRVTATVRKKVSPQNAVSGGAIIKTSRNSIYFGGCKGRSIQREFTIVNSRSGCYLMELRFKDCKYDDFKIVDGDGSLVSQLSFPLERSEKRTVKIVFQTRRLGPISSTLNIYPRSEATRHIKYSIALAGYGGSSHVKALIDNPEKILIPRPVDNYWTCQFALENRGTVPAFTCIQPSADDGRLMDAADCIVLPQCSVVNAGEVKDIRVVIHPPKDKERQLDPFRLRLFWGDDPLRLRWIKCVAKGSVVDIPPAFKGLDWSKLLICDGAVSAVSPTVIPPVVEEDIDLFNSTLRVDDVSVGFNDVCHDSKYMTLAMETATVLETTTSDTILTQRRLTTAGSGKASTDGLITAGVTELIFGSIKVGCSSSQLIPLKNPSDTEQKFRVKEINGPFSMSDKHVRTHTMKASTFMKLPIRFQPMKLGFHSGSVLLECLNSRQLFHIALKGEAF